MDIHQLRVFVSVYKNRSFSKASGDLYLTQPTVSDHIKSLEEELECKLFDRLGRSILPTKEAEALFPHAVEVIEKTRVLKDIVLEVRQEISGELIIGASTIPGSYLMPPLMAAFRAAHPSISFQVISGDSKEIAEKVLAHELLVGIVGAQFSSNDLIYTPLIDDELVLIASPSLAIDNTIAVEQMLSLPFILRERGSGTRSEIERILQSKGIRTTGLALAGVLGSTDAVKQAVKAGMGISIVSRIAVADELQEKKVREIKIEDVVMKRKFHILTHKKRFLPAAYTEFLTYITAHTEHA